jgi:hypothetical protein
MITSRPWPLQVVQAIAISIALTGCWGAEASGARAQQSYEEQETKTADLAGRGMPLFESDP